MSSSDEVLSDGRFESLNDRQKPIYIAKLTRFDEYLRKRGKEPQKEIGYAEKSVRVKLSRFQRVVEWIWNRDGVTTAFAPAHADDVVAALNTDTLRRKDGERFSEGSKRKINDTLINWFEFQDIDWEPDVTFSDESEKDHADLFSRRELRILWQTTLEYKTIPKYNNLSPEDRDRWKAYIAQELGKPKQEVNPDDWDRINTSWKIPSLIRTNREAGWRPDLIGRMSVEWYEEANQTIHIPEGEAVKNDASWDQRLSDEAALALEKWLEQRENMELYDGRSEIWLNREGNPYSSGSLNNLLRNLMDEADISQRDRKLVWYSFRHSIGTYVYEEYTDLTVVAETLRQKSEASAAQYVHPTKELKKEVASIL